MGCSVASAIVASRRARIREADEWHRSRKCRFRVAGSSPARARWRPARMGFPLIGGAQPAGVKVGIIHPVTGFVAFAGSQGRFGATMAVDDINKAGGIKAMGGAKLEPLLGDSQSKVEVGVAEVEKMNEAGRRGLYRLLPEPGRHRRQPGRRQVQHAVPDRRRRLRPDREPRPQERVPHQAGLRRLRRPGHRAAGRAQQGGRRRRQDGGDRPRVGRVRHRHRQAAAGKLPSIGIDGRRS